MGLARKKAAAAVAAPKSAEEIKPGTVVLIGKGADRIPVILRDAAHLEALRETHGAQHVEVQS